MVCQQSTEWNWFVRHGQPEPILSYFWDHLVNSSAYEFFPLHPLPACFLIWQRLGLWDWRENQIKATHQPIANRTENVSLMMGCVTRWKVSLRLCVSKPGFTKDAKLPGLSKQTRIYKMKYANGSSIICGIALDGKWLTLYFVQFLFLLPYYCLLFTWTPL